MKSYRLLIRPEVELDLAAAYRWYEDKDAGLGDEFLRTVEASLLGIQKDPQTHQKIHKDIRRALTKRFPYGIFYVINNDTISVLGVLHARRDPATITARSLTP
jgi:plasmid stabilization system protein ParE